MKTQREEAVLNIIATFEEMADIILAQLILLEKCMASKKEEDREHIISEIRENEDRIDKFEVTISEKFISTIILYQPVASEFTG